MGIVPFEKRYSVIEEKYPREIVLLRGSGCEWRRCRFCDYHLDFSKKQQENIQLNHKVLESVTGKKSRLEIINSGSFIDLPGETIEEIKTISIQKGITELIFESHWMYREKVPDFKAYYQQEGIALKVKIGVETFDKVYRESVLDKGINEENAEKIAEYFDHVCLLQGLEGQTEVSMRTDIETGLRYFERVCINIMVANTMPILPDPKVIAIFQKKIAPDYLKNPRVDILMQNTDFGVGI